MKVWQVVLLALILVLVPVFSGCFDNAAQRQAEEDYRQAVIEAAKQRQQYQKDYEAYQKAVAEGLQEYLNEYAEYQKKVAEQQLQQAQQEESQ